MDVGNYRPVSILSVISKIFERAVYDQVDTYLKEKKLLYMIFSLDLDPPILLIHVSCTFN